MTSTPTAAPSLSSSPSPPANSHCFNIEISSQRQHVGAWYEDIIRDNLKSELLNKCTKKKVGPVQSKRDVHRFDNI
ncbi:hypothetical protein IAQ61_006920 [Plenodomus lingam]|uniref:uncharacterized protein n=1 Tax=Leptosphaeria maculans TaxID=5022 RepID=UPI003327D6CF|nr:hypothetical protein IAQ61_006920 [Plenodomus lingam]